MEGKICDIGYKFDAVKDIMERRVYQIGGHN